MLKKLALASVLTAAAFATPASAAPIFSDNFDGENGGSYQLNYTGFAQWTVTQGSVDLIGNGTYDFYPGNGLYVDLDGSTGQNGGITTNATFGPANYVLTFDLGGSQRGDTNTVIVQFDGVTIGTYTMAGSDPLTPETITFTAGTTGSLAFIQTNPGDNMGLILDNVSLSTADTAVPEPMTLSLFGAGLAAMGLRRRKKA